MDITKLKVIELSEVVPFAQALRQLIDGKCIGIRPGANQNYLVIAPKGIIKNVLQWKGGDTGIRADQYLEEYRCLILDHRQFTNEPEKRK